MSGGRCHLVGMDSRIPSKADYPEYTFAFAYRKPRPIPKTWKWMGNDNGPSFLDLPRELRDMIYIYVCNDLKQSGDVWREKDYDKEHTIPADHQQQAPPFQNCNIMSTCRQVHWEFAEVLYARPLQLYGATSETQSRFILPGSHILSLSSTYAHLVKKLAVLHDTGVRDYQPRSIKTTSMEQQWCHVVTVAMRLAKLFPKVQTVRVLSHICPPDYTDPTWQIVSGLRGKTREEQVEESYAFIRGVCWSDGRHVKMPPQLELMNLDLDTVVETPLVEAARNVRAAELRKRKLAGKRAVA